MVLFMVVFRWPQLDDQLNRQQHRQLMQGTTYTPWHFGLRAISSTMFLGGSCGDCRYVAGCEWASRILGHKPYIYMLYIYICIYIYMYICMLETYVSFGMCSRCVSLSMFEQDSRQRCFKDVLKINDGIFLLIPGHTDRHLVQLRFQMGKTIGL